MLPDNDHDELSVYDNDDDEDGTSMGGGETQGDQQPSKQERVVVRPHEKFRDNGSDERGVNRPVKEVIRHVMFVVVLAVKGENVDLQVQVD